MAELTPMMQQYMQTKKNIRTASSFIDWGDFYEMFFDDALTASKELEITLTGKNCGLERTRTNVRCAVSCSGRISEPTGIQKVIKWPSANSWKIRQLQRDWLKGML